MQVAVDTVHQMAQEARLEWVVQEAAHLVQQVLLMEMLAQPIQAVVVQAQGKQAQQDHAQAAMVVQVL
jgi:hypothetical protein